MGRVKKGDRHQVSIKMPTILLERIDNLAKKHHRDRSSEIIVAIEQYVTKLEQYENHTPESLEEHLNLLRALINDQEITEEIIKRRRDRDNG